MIAEVHRPVLLIAVAGTGLVSGVLFAFSTFVMPALRRLPDPDGLRAMQAINSAAPSSALFMTALLGSAALCALLGITAASRLDEPGGRYELAGALLYLGCVAITVAYHVPRNDSLTLIDSQAAGAADAWHHFYAGWTTWNHVRTANALAGSVLLVLALQAK